MPEPIDSPKIREVIRDAELQEKIEVVENGIEFCLTDEFLPEL